MAFLTPEEAASRIIETAKTLLGDTGTEKDAIYQIYADKLILDVLDYCNRDDFPPALVYTCADLLFKREQDSTSDTQGLKKVKMDDTEFEFATATASPGTAADADFATIRNKLNLYRKLRWN